MTNNELVNKVIVNRASSGFGKGSARNSGAHRLAASRPAQEASVGRAAKVLNVVHQPSPD